MIRRVLMVSILAAGLLIAGLSQASSAIMESRHLIVSDASGTLSNEQLKRLADHAQETLNGVLAFWSAEAGIDRFGKIRVVFDVPRRDVYSPCVRIVVASNKHREETTHHADEIFPRLSYPNDSEDDRP